MNEKSTVLQGFREKMSEAVSIFIKRKQESAFGSLQCELAVEIVLYDKHLGYIRKDSIARTRR